MATHTLTWNERIRVLRGRLELNQPQMAERLAISREWLSKLETGDRPVSEILQIKIERLEKENSVHESANLNSGGKVAEPPARFEVTSKLVASRIPQQRTPSTRADCEAYVQQLFDRATLSEDPNAWPVIIHRLKKEFPLEEWQPPADQDTK